MSFLLSYHIQYSNIVARVGDLVDSNKALLDTPCTHEAIEDIDTSRLIVRPTSPSSTERLLTDDRSCAFVVVIDVPSGVAQTVCGVDEDLAVGCEAGRRDILGLADQKERGRGTYIAPVRAYTEVLSTKSKVFS